MAVTYKVLGQVVPAGANTDIDLYTVPAATTTVVSSIVIANLTTAAVTFRAKVRVAGAASTNKQMLAFDMTVDPNSSIVFTLGITLAATDVLTVQASSTSVAFQAFGEEQT